MKDRDGNGLERRWDRVHGHGRAGLVAAPLQPGRSMHWYRHGRGPALPLQRSLSLLAALLVVVVAVLWLRQM